MADRSSEKREDEIRVVGEPVEEVVRLDVVKVDPLKKKGKPVDVGLIPRVDESEEKNPGQELKQEGQKQEGQKQEAPRKAVFDPEKDWLESKSGSGILDVPIGWFVLVGAGLLGVLAWAVFQVAFTDDDPWSGREGEVLSGKTGSEDSQSKIERVEPAKHFSEMEELVASFLKAETIEEKVKFVRHPKRVLPLMETYYKTHEVKSLTFKETAEYHVAALNKRPFIALSVEVEGGGGGLIPILLEDLDEGVLVDWESYVCYQPIAPEEYIKERPTSLTSLRVYATVDHFFTYEFSDEKEYDCYRLTFRGSEESLFGYVERDGEVAKDFLAVFPDRSSKKKLPLILNVRFLEGSKASRSVLIEGVESRLWAFAEDPDKVATPAELE